MGRFLLNENPLICFKIQLRIEEIIPRHIEFLKCKNGKLLQEKSCLSECLIIESFVNKFLKCKLKLYDLGGKT